MSLSDTAACRQEPTVLVIDDEESFTSSLAHALKREGYRVLTAADGPTGLGLAIRERPEVILLDLMLPGMPGLDVCRAIREAGLPQPGIIMVTAKDTAFEAVVGLESGADDYVAKPFDLNLLMARVRALLRRSRRELSSAMTSSPVTGDTDSGTVPATSAGGDLHVSIGRLTVDPGSYEARYGDRQIDLSPRLFELLLYLARNPGRVVTRDELLNELWGYDYSGQTRTVDVHVHWLRDLLSEAGMPDGAIQTVRGVGYKLVPASLLAGGKNDDSDPTAP